MLRERARPTRALLAWIWHSPSADVPARPAARWRFARHVASDHQCRVPAPIRLRSAQHVQPYAGIEARRAHPVSSVQLPIATSLLRSSLIAAHPEIIPPSLMGHVSVVIGPRLNSTRLSVELRTGRRAARLRPSPTILLVGADSPTLGYSAPLPEPNQLPKVRPPRRALGPRGPTASSGLGISNRPRGLPPPLDSGSG